MMLSSKGPSAQILLTLHIFTIGTLVHICLSTPAHDEWTNARESKSGQTQQSRFLTSDEEPGILLPADDKYNFVGQDDPATTETIWRTGRSSPVPPNTFVSTNSYSIRPGSTSGSSGSTFMVNAKPVPIVTTGSSYTVKNDRDKYFPYMPKNSNKSTVFVKNNCFGHRCSEKNSNDNYQSGDDEWKSYHYVMNKGVKHKQRKLHSRGDRPSRRNNDVDSPALTHEMSLSIPFRVDPTISKYDTSYPNKFSRRVLRTTTPSLSSSTTPGWVKLQPILPDQYDPFTLKSTKNPSKVGNKPHESNKVNPSQFSTRLGVEIDPDSFAERWGWGDRHNDGGGSRYPAWLQGGDNVKGSPDRDSGNRNWVKLEPIPVAGVTISKWVPKGTPNSDLPSTNWPSRDRVGSSNGIGHSNGQSPTSTKWWDIIDDINRQNQNRVPQYGPPSSSSYPSSSNNAYDAPPRGWSANKSPSSLSSWERDRTPQNSWDDIIYPNGPASATVSWQQDKDMSKYASSFPPSTSTSPWQSDLRRPSSSATGSWSADRDRDSYQGGSYGGGNRRQGVGSSYPDRHTTEDDPRWVLVSNSKKVTVSSPDPNRHHPSYPDSGVKYRPDFDKFSDFPYHEQRPYKNRRGKDYKDIVKITNITVTKPGSYLDQDAAFSKVNATLASLTPVLSKRRGYRGNIPDTKKSSTSSSTSSSSPAKMPGFLKPYFGDGRGNKEPEAATTVLLPTTNNNNKVRKGIHINPVYAAVGAGMIPATMAAVLPMMLGRKRREIRFVIETPVDNGADEENLQELNAINLKQPHRNRNFGVAAEPRRKRNLESTHPQSLFSINIPHSLKLVRLRE